MNYIDIIIVIVVLIFAFKGFQRGFIKEFISFVAIILGLYIASHFSIFLEKILLKITPEDYEQYVSIFSFAVVFTLIYLSLKLAQIVVSKIAKQLKLGVIDHPAGLLFGGAKMLLLFAIILFETDHLEQQFGGLIPKEQKESSALYQPIKNIVPAISPIVKERIYLQRKLDDKIEEIKKPIDQ